jgi:hypothetical protein
MAQLPALTLEAAGSGRAVTLNAVGCPLVLICHGQETAPAAFEVNNAVRAQFADAGQVCIASVIDLRQFPSMFHGMVRPELEKAYRKAAEKLPEGADPAEFVVLLPDWKGEATDALEAGGSTKTAVVVVADADAGIAGIYRGEEPGQGALELLSDIVGRTDT